MFRKSLFHLRLPYLGSLVRYVYPNYQYVIIVVVIIVNCHHT